MQKKLIIAAILVIVIGFSIYNYFFAAKKTKNSETERVHRGDLAEKLTISGTVDAEEKATLRFSTSGRLTWVGIKEGDHVKKYQSIASLDQREVKKKFQKLLDDYQISRWDFDQKTKDTYRDQVLSDTIKRVIDTAQFNLNKSILDVEIQNLAVEFSNLWTPIDGIVTRVSSPYAGVNIIPTQAEFDIVNPDTVYFSANADQTEVVKLFENMNGELTLDAFPDSTISGTIKNISFIPKSGETGTVYAVKFIFNTNNFGYKYRVGMGGDLTFVLKNKIDVLYITPKYIKNDNGKKYVNLKDKNKEIKAFVKTGIETDSGIEIIEGVKEGDVISN